MHTRILHSLPYSLGSCGGNRIHRGEAPQLLAEGQVRVRTAVINSACSVTDILFSVFEGYTGFRGAEA